MLRNVFPAKDLRQIAQAPIWSAHRGCASSPAFVARMRRFTCDLDDGHPHLIFRARVRFRNGNPP